MDTTDRPDVDALPSRRHRRSRATPTNVDLLNGGLSPVDGSRVLIVCTGNIIRSPFIAGLLAKHLGDEVQVTSAGTAARVGEGADPAVTEIARAYEVDLGAHRACQLEESVLDAAGTILCASSRHKGSILKLRPARLRHVFTVREFGRLAAIAPDDLGESLGERWNGLLRFAGISRALAVTEDPRDDDIVDPYLRDASTWWAFEESAVPATIDVLRLVRGAR